MPKPRSLIPSRKLKFDVPLDLLEQVDARLYDPLLEAPGYGQRRALLVRLLTEWVARTPLHPQVQARLDAEGAASPRLEALLATMTRS